MPRGRARQFLEQRRSIVRRHFVQNGNDLLVRHAAQQFLLRLEIEIFEDVGGERVWQNAKNDDPLVLRKIEDDLGHVGRGHLGKELAQRGEIPRVDHALDFR